MKNEAKVGLFIIVALLIFVVTFLSVATVQLSGTKVPFRAHFKFAGGLAPGTLVRFGGLKAGVINDVRPSPEDPTLAEVRFDMREDVPVNEDSIARISSLNALGDNYLEISPGTKEARLLPPNSIVPSEEAITFSDITAKVAEVADTASELMIDIKDDVEGLIHDLRDLTANLQELTGEENQRNVRDMLRNANTMIGEQRPKIDQLTTQLSEVLEKVDLTINDMRKVAQSADLTVKNVDRTVTEIREPVKRDLEELERTLVQAREMLAEVQALVVVNRQNITDTVENFRNTSENLEQFSDEIRQRPWILLRTKPKPDRPVGGGSN